MGSFFTNAQISVRDRDATRARDDVIDALCALAKEDGFVESASSDANDADAQPADRTILVEAGAGWISVYDEATEGQQQDRLDRLAAVLSRRLETDAVAILVHDSDILELRLFHAGKLVDRFNDHPAYFGKVSAAEKKAAAGQPDRWAPLLAPGHDAAALAAAWREQPLFSEATLAKTAELLGLDPARAGVGFNYADKGDARYTALRFRHAVRPAYEAPAGGPPRFEMGGHSPKQEFSVGFHAKIGASVRNAGGGSRGVAVVVFGEAIECGLVAVDSAELVVGQPRQATRTATPFEDRQSGDGKRLRVARFADVDIPAGAAGGMQALAGLDPRKMVDAMYASNVHANIDARGVAVGQAELHVGFLPLAATDGQYAHTIVASVTAAPRRPLRTPAAEAHALRPLEARDTLFALVSMDLDRAAAAAAAATIIERWGALIEQNGSFTLSVFRSQPGARPGGGTAKAKGFFGSARWKKLRGEMETERLVCAQRIERDPEAFERAGSGDGFSFGGEIIAHEIPGDPELPTLGLWLDVRNAPAERLDAASRLAERLMDEAMSEHRGVQALCGRWAWAPSMGFDSTPYELACGVHGQCTLQRSWLTCFVRGVTVGTLWLGEPLVERIGDLAALGEAARITRQGGTLRVGIERAEALDAVEAAIAPLLPTGDDWQRGVARLYGRE